MTAKIASLAEATTTTEAALGVALNATTERIEENLLTLGDTMGVDTETGRGKWARTEGGIVSGWIGETNLFLISTSSWLLIALIRLLQIR